MLMLMLAAGGAGRFVGRACSCLSLPWLSPSPSALPALPARPFWPAWPSEPSKQATEAGRGVSSQLDSCLPHKCSSSSPSPNPTLSLKRHFLCPSRPLPYSCLPTIRTGDSSTHNSSTLGLAPAQLLTSFSS